MQKSEILRLAESGTFQEEPLKGKVDETHISWVILTGEYAFKVKKPLKLSFLDFSTLHKRKKYCEREILLNSRFSEIYLAVVPISLYKGNWYIGESQGEVVDYAVMMKKMASFKLMDKLLKKGKVKEKNMKPLAEIISSFHSKAKIIYDPFQLSEAKETFNDLAQITDFLEQQENHGYMDFIKTAINWSNGFLDKYEKHFQQRIANGYKRDVHGDLHSGNVFLYKKPVLFDCIEFNDQYRQIDLLYEVAFLCMDLEFFSQKQLAGSFLSHYTRGLPCMEGKEDKAIFIYFKCLRANIRAKVHAISGEKAHQQAEIKQHAGESIKYLDLMKEYIAAQAT